LAVFCGHSVFTLSTIIVRVAKRTSNKLSPCMKELMRCCVQVIQGHCTCISQGTGGASLLKPIFVVHPCKEIRQA